MKISYNWLKEYINFDLPAEEMGRILTDSGLEVEGIEKVEKVPGGLKGLVIGEVLKKDKHPNADRLSVTEVGIGEGEPLQIVCGAPNVDKGQKVVVATVGTVLYPTQGDSFKIKKGKIRGEVSMGMICAEDEIGLGESHDGIMVLDADAKVGTPANEYFDLSDDYCIEIGLTPNRTDGMSHIGVARDLVAAVKNVQGQNNIESAEYSWPDLSSYQKDNDNLLIDVVVENKQDCPRYCGVTLTEVKVADSPQWLQEKLTAIGLAPINNVVDITNFVLHEFGQPLHAFDADKIEGNKVVVKNLEKGSKFISLDEIERELDTADLMICNDHKDNNQAGMCIAGVFGGIDSGVSEKTVNVFLESAYFNPVSIRKSSKRHQLNTDASFRFERGVDPNRTIEALKRAALLIKEIAGAKISSDIIDLYPEPIENFNIDFDITNIKRLIGTEIEESLVDSIFSDLDIEVINKDGNNWNVSVPPYRADVQRQADLVEEILRIYGYNNIVAPDQFRSSLSYTQKPDREKLQILIGSFLSSRGFLEMMSNSLTKEQYLDIYTGGTVDNKAAVRILNPLSRDLNVMRQSLIFGALEAVIRNQNFKNEDLALYEFGKEYRKGEDKYKENSKLIIVLSGKKAGGNWNQKEEDYSFFDLKGSFESILGRLGLLNNPIEGEIENDLFEDGISYKIQNKVIANLGYVRSDLMEQFDIRNKVWIADIDWDAVVKMSKNSKVKYQEVPKYPSMRRDLSLLVDSQIKFAEIKALARKTEKKILKDTGLFDVYEGKNLPQGKKSYAVRFTFMDEQKTLTDNTVDQVMSKIQKNLEKELGAQLR